MSTAVVFDQKLIKQFTPTINIIIKQKIHNNKHSEFCYEHEDIFQECLEHLWKATLNYKPDRGMKFRTFAIMLLHSRLGNMRNKITRKARNQVVTMSALNAGWGITGTEVSDEGSEATVSTQYSGFIDDLKEGNNALNEILDAKSILNKLTGEKKILFSEYYIQGKKLNEICEDHPKLKYHQIRRHMRNLDQIYKTLIKGETPCLQ